jgi:hypothetical protein
MLLCINNIIFIHGIGARLATTFALLVLLALNLQFHDLDHKLIGQK